MTFESIFLKTNFIHFRQATFNSSALSGPF